MSDLRKAAEQMLDAVDAVLYAAYDRAFPVCCGKCSESGCCGQPDQTWTPQDEALMALLGPVERNLRTALAAEQEKKTPAWWMDGLAATLMREGVNKHRAREIAQGYWEAYCQIPGNEEEPI